MSRKPEALPPVYAWNLIPPVVTAEQMMAILENGRTQFDELLAAGMPCINLSASTGRRMLRFEPEAVIAWLRARNGGGR